MHQSVYFVFTIKLCAKPGNRVNRRKAEIASGLPFGQLSILPLERMWTRSEIDHKTLSFHQKV
jgi:hypothetical protein